MLGRSGGRLGGVGVSLRFLRPLLEFISLMVDWSGWRLSVWATHLSTAATIGDTVMAAVSAVMASIRSLVGRCRFSTTGSVAICSIDLTLIVQFQLPSLDERSCMVLGDGTKKSLVSSSTQANK